MMVRFARAGAKRFARKPYLEDATPWSEMFAAKSSNGVEDLESENPNINKTDIVKFDDDSQSTSSSSEEDDEVHSSSDGDKVDFGDELQSTSSFSEEDDDEESSSSKDDNEGLGDQRLVEEASTSLSEELQQIHNSSGCWMVQVKICSNKEREVSHKEDEASRISKETFLKKQTKASQEKLSSENQDKTFWNEHDEEPSIKQVETSLSRKNKHNPRKAEKPSHGTNEVIYSKQRGNYHRKQMDHNANEWCEPKVKYGKHRLTKRAAEQMDAMKERLLKNGVAEDDVKDAVQLAARREEKRDYHRRQKEDGMVCFACQKPGHRFADCPNKSESEKGVLCYTCGSSEHISRSCPKNANNENMQVFPNAVCFRCNETGHIARQCSTSKLTCMGCGEVGHIKRHCPSSAGYRPNQMKRGFGDNDYSQRCGDHNQGSGGYKSAKKPKVVTF